MDLNQRTKQILFSLVHSYINTGEPVASRTVVKKTDLKLSPATVRNILADLDEMGYLTQPHASAGRIPTDTGYRFYVNHLMENIRLSSEVIDQVASHYVSIKQKKELDTLFQETSQILSEASQYIGLVVAPKLTHVTYNHMEFIRLAEHGILLILVSQSGFVHSRLISTDMDLSQDDLNELTSYANEELCGLTLEQVRERIVRKMAADMHLYQGLLKKIFLTDESSELLEPQGQIYLEGTYNILDLPGFSDLKRIKRILQAFERKSMLVQLLDWSMDSEGVMVYIGSENPLRILEDCSLVTANYKYKDKVVGTLGVIGPKRMDYSKVISVVDCTSQLLSQFISC
ncbi:MAG: heat-inducible transcriptional repressor HrcA [bacterium]